MKELIHKYLKIKKMNQIYIYFHNVSDLEGPSISQINLPSVPFRVGDLITITVINSDVKQWDVDPLGPQEFEVTKIEYDITRNYGSGVSDSCNCFVWVKS
jgi:hypothetical protein